MIFNILDTIDSLLFKSPWCGGPMHAQFHNWFIDLKITKRKVKEIRDG